MYLCTQTSITAAYGCLRACWNFYTHHQQASSPCIAVGECSYVTLVYNCCKSGNVTNMLLFQVIIHRVSLFPCKGLHVFTCTAAQSVAPTAVIQIHDTDAFPSSHKDKYTYWCHSSSSLLAYSSSVRLLVNRAAKHQTDSGNLRYSV